ncbi:MAG: hypothetical protein IJ091_02340 [Oscillospiraceae bacterium]|nr:hypothetical protein [Oscillospiraceae bacterium]
MSSSVMYQVYYEHGYPNNRDTREERILPYMVRIFDESDRMQFKEFLEKRGYHCVNTVKQLNGILVNTEFKRFAGLILPVKHSCVSDRHYSAWEFFDEILHENSKDVFVHKMYLDHMKRTNNGIISFMQYIDSLKKESG